MKTRDSEEKWKRSDSSDSDSVELMTLAYDSDFRFSLGHKLSYDSDYDSDSDSVASENQPLGFDKNKIHLDFKHGTFETV